MSIKDWTSHMLICGGRCLFCSLPQKKQAWILIVVEYFQRTVSVSVHLDLVLLRHVLPGERTWNVPPWLTCSSSRPEQSQVVTFKTEKYEEEADSEEDFILLLGPVQNQFPPVLFPHQTNSSDHTQA